MPLTHSAAFVCVDPQLSVDVLLWDRVGCGNKMNRHPRVNGVDVRVARVKALFLDESQLSIRFQRSSAKVENQAKPDQDEGKFQ